MQRLFLLLTIWVLLATQPADAAVYYLSPQGSDANNGSSGNPWASFAHAFSRMSGGDALVLKDGTYNQPIGRYQWSGGVQVPLDNPPSGSSAQPTLIRAEHDGKAIVQVTNGSNAMFLGNNYVQVEGLKFIGMAGVAYISGGHITIKRTAFGSKDAGSSSSIISLYGSDTLIEDCWAWGGGRAGIQAGGQHITIRRFVARMDSYEHEHEHTAVLLYKAKDVIVENAIALDFNPSNSVANAHTMRAGFRSRNGYGAVDHRFHGVIALNLQGTSSSKYHGWELSADGNTLCENCVAWDVSYSGVWAIQGDSLKISNSTIGNAGYCLYASSVALKNSLVTECPTTSVAASSTQNIFYNAPTGGSNYLTSPPQQKYLTRVETGSPGHGTGLNGGHRGAELLYRYQNGALTTTSLWPWPNEARIKADMRDNFGFGNPQRGFAASGTGLYGGPITLTSYIWEYLGYPCPSGVCSGAAPPPPPPPPTLAALIHVDNVLGSDTNAGTQSQPVKTITRAISLAASDAEIRIKATTAGYTGACVDKTGLSLKGVDGTPVINKLVTCDGRKVLLYSRANDVSFFNLELDMRDFPGQQARALIFSGTASNPIHRNHADKVFAYGPGYSGNGRSMLSSSYCYDCILENSSSDGSEEHGIYWTNHQDGAIIRNNVVTNASGSCLQLNSDPETYSPGHAIQDGIMSDNLVEGNVFYDCGVSSGAAINLAGVRDSVFRNNLIYGTRMVGGIASWDDGYSDWGAAGDFRFGSKNNQFVNNTLDCRSCTRHAISFRNGSDSNEVKNNIVLTSSDDAIAIDSESNANLAIDHNLYLNGVQFEGTGGNWIGLAAWRNTYGYDTHSIETGLNGLFVDVAAQNYELADASSAIDRGTAVVVQQDIAGRARPQGATFDIGAYEHGGGVIWDGMEVAVTASSHDGNIPENTLDGDLATRWSANGIGQWVQYDFGTAKAFQGVEIAFYLGDQRTATFDIYVGNDPQALTRVFQGSSSGSTLQLQHFAFAPVSARYLRIVGLGNSSNAWNSLTEVSPDMLTTGETEVIVDNDDASAVTFSGQWTTSTYADGFYGRNYHYSCSTNTSKSARFVPNLPTSGSYEVFGRWSANPNRATNVPFDIVHSTGIARVTVNQQVNGAQWNSLGVYSFAAGTRGAVLIRTDGTNGCTIADALRFVAVGSVANQVSMTIPADGASVEGTVWMTADASGDPIGVAFYVNGLLRGDEDTAAPYSVPLYTKSLREDGSHTIKAVARYADGSIVESDPVTVIADNY